MVMDPETPGSPACIFPEVRRSRIWHDAEGHKKLKDAIKGEYFMIVNADIFRRAFYVLRTTTANDVPGKEEHECESWVGVGVGEEELVEEVVSWAQEPLCFSPFLPVNWKPAGDSLSALCSPLLQNTQI